jgi:hypothetical protein
VAARGIIDYQRMFSGYDIIHSSTDPNEVNKTTVYQDEFALYHAPQPLYSRLGIIVDKIQEVGLSQLKKLFLKN